MRTCIPKIIHYVWLGDEKKRPELMVRCLNSWKKNCPDYQIIEWGNKEAAEIKNSFLQQAIDRRSWAFAADFLRLYALKSFGGIYVDSDLEITRPIDEFLKYRFILSFEDEVFPSTAFIGSERGGRVISALLDYYENRDFVLKDGSEDRTPNPQIFYHILNEKFKQWNYVELGDSLILGSGEVIFPPNYFSKFVDGRVNYAVHHFAASWVSEYTVVNLLKVGCLRLCKVKQKNKFFDIKKFIKEYPQNIFSFEYKKNKFFVVVKSDSLTKGRQG